jgi:hypothetical protein
MVRAGAVPPRVFQPPAAPRQAWLAQPALPERQPSAQQASAVPPELPGLPQVSPQLAARPDAHVPAEPQPLPSSA